MMIATGFVLLGLPYFTLIGSSSQSSSAVNEFRETAELVRAQGRNPYEIPEETSSEISSPDDTSRDTSSKPQKDESSEVSDSGRTGYENLFFRMRDYNNEIFENKQSGLRDIFSYSNSDIKFTDFGIDNGVVGYISIERMGIELPVYVGSNSANMRLGATVMNRTSMPIGGINTNCVIAAHRSAGYFGDIELLQIGDIIRLNNLWRELKYKVVKIIVIDPYDTQKIKIVPGKDMLTLLTCHPYWSNRTRYIVYCERVQDGAPQKTETSAPEASESVPAESTDYDDTSLPDGIEYTASQDTINAEHVVRIGGMILSGVCIIVFVILMIRRRTKKNSSDSDSPPEVNTDPEQQ